jgi:O-antigen/teichoic acid export membrane protein
MSALKTNVLVSTAAMLLVGGMRPLFNAVVNQSFGAEVNGHAGMLISLIFLASLPATASIPPVMVRHVSRALGRNDRAEANAHIKLAAIAAAVLSISATAAVLLRYELSWFDAVMVAVGIGGYAYWRLIRSLFMAIGRAVFSLKADVFGALSMPLLLAPIVLYQRPGWAIAAYVAVWVGFALVTLPVSIGSVSGKRAPYRSVWADFLRYNVLNMIGTTSSLAGRELAVLVLAERTNVATVGEFSVVLSFLTLLAFAPRVLELPMLSELAGKTDPAEQRALTERALHFMWIVVFSIGCGAAILAPVILRAGAVFSHEMAIAFAVIAFMFMSEMLQSPATNLLFAEAHPRVLATIGFLSLAGALLWWYVPAFALISPGLGGVVIGLGISHAIKAIGIGAYARLRFSVRAFSKPLTKAITTLAGMALAFASLYSAIHPLLAFVIFEAVMLAAFHRDVIDLLRFLRR